MNKAKNYEQSKQETDKKRRIAASNKLPIETTTTATVTLLLLCVFTFMSFKEISVSVIVFILIHCILSKDVKDIMNRMISCQTSAFNTTYITEIN